MDTKRLKVAFLSRYSGEVDRGVETYVLELSKRLSKNCDVSVLAGKDSDSFQKIIKGKYDVIIATNGRMQALKASVTRLFSKHKLIISGQAGIGKDDLWNLLIVRPDTYVALTDYELSWAKKWAFGINLTKIPNGVDLQKFTPEGEKVKVDLEGCIVLSVGALFWYKHHELTIKAVSRLPNTSLLIIGKGPEKDGLEQLGKKLLGEKRFKILDVNFDQIPSYYRSVQVFTLPSWIRESFGIVYVEAMASGLPVVAPSDSPRKEIIGDGGVLVDVNDNTKFALALEEAIETKWEDKPKKQAGKFSWDSIANQYEELFKRLTSRGYDKG